MQVIAKLAVASILLSFVSLLFFRPFIGPGHSAYYFGFHYNWYVTGIADMVGTFRYLSITNALKDLGLWTPIALCTVLIVHNRLYRRKSSQVIDRSEKITRQN